MEKRKPKIGDIIFSKNSSATKLGLTKVISKNKESVGTGLKVKEVIIRDDEFVILDTVFCLSERTYNNCYIVKTVDEYMLARMVEEL